MYPRLLSHFFCSSGEFKKSCRIWCSGFSIYKHTLSIRPLPSSESHLFFHKIFISIPKPNKYMKNLIVRVIILIFKACSMGSLEVIYQLAGHLVLLVTEVIGRVISCLYDCHRCNLRPITLFQIIVSFFLQITFRPILIVYNPQAARLIQI